MRLHIRHALVCALLLLLLLLLLAPTAQRLQHAVGQHGVRRAS
jgi:hypothetical protein